MYKRLTRSRIRVEIASPAYLRLEIIQIIIFPCINAWRDSVYVWILHPTPPFGVRNYLNNYVAMCKRLTRSRIRVELASPAYLGLGVI